MPPSKGERGEIISVLCKDEEKMLVYRPRLIQNRSKAATLCFMEVDPNFHEEFDQTFSMKLVMEALTHMNSLVRRLGIDAFGSCFKNYLTMGNFWKIF